MIQRRNMGMQVLLMIVTLGIYGIYWFYVTSQEIVEHKSLDGSAGLWTVLLFVPFGAFYSYYKQGEAVEALTDNSMSKWILFIQGEAVEALTDNSIWLIYPFSCSPPCTCSPPQPGSLPRRS